MESFKVNLSQLNNRSNKQPYYFFFLGLIYFIVGILFQGKTSSDKFSGWIWIISGAGFIITSLYQKNTTSKNVFELNDKSIFAHPSFGKNITIDWNNLEQIHIKPISFDFILKNGSKESISLGNLAYKDVLETKEKLVEFAKEKNITIN